MDPNRKLRPLLLKGASMASEVDIANRSFSEGARLDSAVGLDYRRSHRIIGGLPVRKI